MTPIVYSDEGWVHPARTVQISRCALGNCTPGDLPGQRVMTVTLDENGWCASCRRTVDDEHTKLWIGDDPC